MDVTRLDNFLGSDEQYVFYLEMELLRCREHLSNLFYSRVTPPPSPTAEAQTCQLEISQFNPSTISPAKKVPQWRGEMDKFLADIPPIALWEESRGSLGLISPDSMVHVLATLLGVGIPNRIFDPQDTFPTIPASLISSPLLRPAYSFAISTIIFKSIRSLLPRYTIFENFSWLLTARSW